MEEMMWLQVVALAAKTKVAIAGPRTDWWAVGDEDDRPMLEEEAELLSSRLPTTAPGLNNEATARHLAAKELAHAVETHNGNAAWRAAGRVLAIDTFRQDPEACRRMVRLMERGEGISVGELIARLSSFPLENNVCVEIHRHGGGFESLLVTVGWEHNDSPPAGFALLAVEQDCE